MRAATHDTQWLETSDGKLQGICLGYDFVAQHEWGIKELLQAFGVNLPAIPVGLRDRTITEVPETLCFMEYDHIPADKRRKKVKAASLVFVRYGSRIAVPQQEYLGRLELAFYSDIGERWYKPQDDLRCAWSGESFGINVRGAENIAKLKQLADAFARKDIAIASPSSLGFQRNGLSFVIPSTVAEESVQSIEKADLAYKRLMAAVDASGIKSILEAAGRKWHALKPEWYDKEKEEGLMFYLNPAQQNEYQSGWYSVEDLKAWAKNIGPVIKDPVLEEYEHANRDWRFDLTQGMELAGVAMRLLPRLERISPDNEGIGVRVFGVTYGDSKVYPISELQAKYLQRAEVV